MQITYFGHASFLIEIGGSSILFDPFITGNPLATGIDITTIHPDFILVSHGHQDHVLDVEAIAKQSDATLISTFEVASWFEKKGVTNVVGMNHGGAVDLPFGSLQVVNAIHSSSLPDGTYGGNPAGFVIASEGRRVYYSGDTALTYDMRLIGEDGAVDPAFLCIGDHFTMGVQDAVKAANFVQSKRVVGMHYDTFPPIEIDKEKAQEVFAQEGIELILPVIGKKFEI